MSLISHRSSAFNGPVEFSFVHWLAADNDLGQIVRLDKEDKMISLIPWHNPRVTFTWVEMFLPDFGERADRRHPLSLRLKPPAHALRLREMFAGGLANGATALSCSGCGGKAGDDGMRCSLCLLSFHKECHDSIYEKQLRMESRVPTPDHAWAVPDVLKRSLCRMCSSITPP